MPVYAWVLVAVGGVLLFLLAFMLYAYRVAFYSPPRKQLKEGVGIPSGAQYDERRARFDQMKAAMREAPFEEVTTTSHDRLRLVGRYYARTEGAPVHIIFHGYRSAPIGDACGAFRITQREGHNMLAVYQRASGKSEGRTITFGVLESQDVLTWINYVQTRCGAQTPIFLHGISMGSATVLTATGLALPPCVVGIFADCGYTSPRAILCSVMRQMHYPPALTYPILRLAARLFGGFDPEARSAIDGVTRATVPILFAHGEEDTFVPYSMVHELFDACACEDKTLITFPNAAHGLSYITDTSRYEREAHDFVVRCLQSK